MRKKRFPYIIITFLFIIFGCLFGCKTTGRKRSEETVIEPDVENEEFVIKEIEEEITLEHEHKHETEPEPDKQTVPNVYITGQYQWYQHFGIPWRKASIIIKNSDNTQIIMEETPVKIHDRGNSTRWEEKVPYSIKFDKKQEILGMKKSKSWVLLANFFDRSLIRNRFISYLGNEIFDATWNPQFKPVNLYINDEYFGTYDLGENIKIEKNRLNFPSVEDYVEGKVNTKEECGFVLEIDMRMKQCYDFYSNVYKLGFNLKEPDFKSANKEYDSEKVNEVFEYAKTKINEFEKVLSSKDFAKKYDKYIDVNSFVDWYLINEFAKNYDSVFQTSVFVFYDPVKQKLCLGPSWDFDIALGNCFGGEDSLGLSCDNPAGWYVHGGKKEVSAEEFGTWRENAIEVSGEGYYQAYWINRLFEAPSFKAAVKARWMEKAPSLKSAIVTKVPEYASVISPEIARNEKRLPRLGQYSWNGPTGFKNRTKYEDEISYLKDWCLKRFEWMDAEIKKW